MVAVNSQPAFTRRGTILARRVLPGQVTPVRSLALITALTLIATAAIGVQVGRAGAAPRRASDVAQVSCGAMTPPHPRSGETVRVSVRLSGYEATLTGTYGGVFPSGISKALLVIREHGHAVLSEALGRGPDFFKGSVMLGLFPVYGGPSPTAQGALCVGRLASGERPSVLLDLYTGGAHCCTVLDGYGFSSPRRQLVSIDLGNPGASLDLEAGRFIVLTADNSFAYAFSSFAGSGMPVEVLSFTGDAFANVTRDYLGIVAEDANIWQSGYYQDPSSASGLLAAWVADEDLLGRSSYAWSFVESALRSGEMKVTPWFKTDAGYLNALRALLVKDGYQAA